MNISGWPGYVFMEKLREQKLKVWNRDIYGSIEQEKVDLQSRISYMDVEEERGVCPLTCSQKD